MGVWGPLRHGLPGSAMSLSLGRGPHKSLTDFLWTPLARTRAQTQPHCQRILVNYVRGSGVETLHGMHLAAPGKDSVSTTATFPTLTLYHPPTTCARPTTDCKLVFIERSKRRKGGWDGRRGAMDEGVQQERPECRAEGTGSALEAVTQTCLQQLDLFSRTQSHPQQDCPCPDPLVP